MFDIKDALEELERFHQETCRKLDAVLGPVKLDTLKDYAYDYGYARNLGKSDAEAHAYATARNGQVSFFYFSPDGVQLGIIAE